MNDSKVMFTPSGFKTWLKYSKMLEGLQKREFHQKTNQFRDEMEMPLTPRQVMHVYVNMLSFPVLIKA